MTYTHLSMKELGWIEAYFDIGYKAYDIAKKLGRSNQPIYNVVNFFKKGGTIRDYFERYTQNKSKCGAKKKTFTRQQTQYVKDRVADGWTPDVIIGRGERDLGCSMRTLYRRFKDSALFDVTTLPMQGKRKPNGHKETRGSKQIKERLTTVRKLIPPTKESSDI